MVVQILFFAGLREMLGQAVRHIEVPEGSNVAEVVERLKAGDDWEVPEGIPLLYAVNESFETADKKLEDGDRLAIMTPVSGG